MNFLNPTAIAIAAGLTIPPLIALYFLKLKRHVRVVPSTFLWKRSVEDLQVNSPFQRLRSSLLLLLQLLVLIAGAIALGRPMFKVVQHSENTLILLIDQSASMAIVEADGRTRLEAAKEKAKRCVDNMSADGRAMVIEFSDRAMVVSSFDTDKASLKRKIDSVEQTQSRSELGEAMSLAEAYTQNIMIGTDQAGSDLAPESTAPPAQVFLFSDGRIEDADKVALQRFKIESIQLSVVGERGDNVGIVAMDARRNYEVPELLEVAATVQNFGDKPVSFDVTLYIDSRNVDIQTVQLNAAGSQDGESNAEPANGSVRVVAFDQIEFEGGGLLEVTLQVDDALSADDRAWTVIDPPRHLRTLLVTEGNIFLENALATLPLDVVKMTGADYEGAEDNVLAEGDRSAFDVVILDRHSTARLPQGNYLFWGALPEIDGVVAGRVIDDEVIFNWDDTHPVLRHVAVESLHVYQWLQLTLPPEATSIIDGETSPVMSYLTRDASQYLISAFSLTTEDDLGNLLMNTYWVTTPDFVMFVQNTVYYLGAGIAATSRAGVAPGDPLSFPLPPDTVDVIVRRPDGEEEKVRGTEFQRIHYARTRLVGPYRVTPGVAGQDVFAVNLFNPIEGRALPAKELTLGASTVAATAGDIEINEPAWPYLVLAILVLLVIEWIVYNRRVFV